MLYARNYDLPHYTIKKIRNWEIKLCFCFTKGDISPSLYFIGKYIFKAIKNNDKAQAQVKLWAHLKLLSKELEQNVYIYLFCKEGTINEKYNTSGF